MCVCVYRCSWREKAKRQLPTIHISPICNGCWNWHTPVSGIVVFSLNVPFIQRRIYLTQQLYPTGTNGTTTMLTIRCSRRLRRSCRCRRCARCDTFPQLGHCHPLSAFIFDHRYTDASSLLFSRHSARSAARSPWRILFTHLSR